MARCRVLLVEDEALIVMLVEDVLTGMECDVVVACQGQEALNLIKHELPFHLAVVDLGLPDIGGGVVIRELWARSPVPVIVSTGQAEMPEEVVRDLSPFPAPLVCLSKPWNENELRATVRRLIYGFRISPDPLN